MALFKKKENSEKQEVKSEKKQTVKKAPAKKTNKAKKDSRDVPARKPKKVSTTDLSWVLLNPRITERSAVQSENKIYVFNVHKDANKIQVKEAIAKKFDVVPVKVNITKIASKPVFRKGVHGKKPEGKKAYVYLSKKDNIQFV